MGLHYFGQKNLCLIKQQTSSKFLQSLQILPSYSFTRQWISFWPMVTNADLLGAQNSSFLTDSVCIYQGSLARKKKTNVSFNNPFSRPKRFLSQPSDEGPKQEKT